MFVHIYSVCFVLVFFFIVVSIYFDVMMNSRVVYAQHTHATLSQAPHISQLNIYICVYIFNVCEIYIYMYLRERERERGERARRRRCLICLTIISPNIYSEKFSPKSHKLTLLSLVIRLDILCFSL